MPRENDPDASIRRGLFFLERSQSEDGGFRSLSSGNPSDFSAATPRETTFFPSLILSCLSRLNDPVALGIRNRTAAMLLKEKSADWSFNYWQRQSPDAAAFPSPDDLDDTFCAAAALMQHDRRLVDGEALSSLLSLLVAREAEEGGPYRTWLTADRRGQDTDCAVNANIARFLLLHDVRLPNVGKLIDSAIDEGRYESPYYCSPFPLFYFFSCVASAPQKLQLQSDILRMRAAATGRLAPLHESLALLALLECGAEPPELESVAASILLGAREDGSWPAAAFCRDPNLSGRMQYAGSAGLTTAFCIAALHAWKAAAAPESESHRRDSEHLQRIFAFAERRLAAMPAPLDADLLSALAAFRRKKSELPHLLLPLRLGEALGGISERITLGLGAAALLGALAYALCDDCIDEGSAASAPMASACGRELALVVAELFREQPDAQAFFSGVLGRLDAGILRECRSLLKPGADGGIPLPDALPAAHSAARLADKSIGYLFAPGCALLAASCAADGPEMRGLTEFFENYIAARQLNDDCHDWRDDLRAGRLTDPVCLLLHCWQKGHPDQRIVHPEREHASLHDLFWSDCIPAVSRRIEDHVRAARQALAGSAVLSQCPDFEALIAPLAVAAQDALLASADMRHFMRAYEKRAARICPQDQLAARISTTVR